LIWITQRQQSAGPGHVGQGDYAPSVIDHIGNEPQPTELSAPDVRIACRERTHRIIWVLDHLGHGGYQGVERLTREAAKLLENPLG
jgi:hypothetical protein